MRQTQRVNSVLTAPNIFAGKATVRAGPTRTESEGPSRLDRDLDDETVLNLHDLEKMNDVIIEGADLSEKFDKM